MTFLLRYHDFQKLPTAWVFGGRMIEAREPGSRYVARVDPAETDLQRADPAECARLPSELWREQHML